MAYKDEPDERDKVAWNIAGAFSKLIFNLISKAVNFNLAGDLGKWYDTLRSIREMINHDLTKGEKTEIDDMEKMMNGYIPSWNTYTNKIEEGLVPNDEKKKEIAQFSGLIRKYQRRIMELVKKVGYLPSKEDTTQLGF